MNQTPAILTSRRIQVWVRDVADANRGGRWAGCAAADPEGADRMTVYVDDAFIKARVGRINGKWCHLTADTKDELHGFAEGIGLRRAWFQNKPGGRWHYDVTESMRAKAIIRGAVPVAYRDMPSIMRAPGREGVEEVTR